MRFPALCFPRPVAVIAIAAFCTAAMAHGSRVGDIYVGHAYAPPSLAGSANGVAYFANLENTGARPDRLLRASTPAAASVEMHSMGMDAKGVMRMREVEAIVLAPKAAIKMRPGQGLHLMLIRLRRPLGEGTRFPMTLVFERAGKVDVEVAVESPRASSAPATAHSH